MPPIAITPNQIFRVPVFSIFFGVALLFLILSVVFLVVYNSRHVSKITKDNQVIVRPAPKSLLIVSLSMAVLSLLCLVVAFVRYYMIFGTRFSMGLLAIIIPGVGSAALLVASIVYFAKKEAFCPKGKRFDKKLSMCVDICAPGSRLNEQGLCIVGCDQKEDCPPNHDCVSGTCCDLSLNVKTDDGVCCPRPNVKIIDGKTACCPVVCGKECCSEEFTCGPTGKCLLKCGYTTCDPDESYCLSYPQGLIDSRQTTTSSPTPSADGRVYMCTTISPSCARSDKPFFAPNPIGDGFYPSFDASGLEEGDIRRFLQATEPDDFRAASENFDKNKTDYLCGLTLPVQFQSDRFDNCKDRSFCLDQVYYGLTNSMNIIEKDGGLVCNQTINPNKSPPEPVKVSAAGPSLIAAEPNSYTKTYGVKDPDGKRSISRSNVMFKTSLPGAGATIKLAAEGETKNSAVCTDKRNYTRECKNLGSCAANNTCPFSTDKVRYDCNFPSGKPGFAVQPQLVHNGCKAKDGNLVCAQDPDQTHGPCNTSNDCKIYLKQAAGYNNELFINAGTCTKSAISPGDFLMMGGAGHWTDGTDKGDCNFEQIVKENFRSKSCPPGFQPFFYTGGKISKPSLQKGCSPLGAEYTVIRFKCCDASAFDPNQHPTDAPPSGPDVLNDEFSVVWTGTGSEGPFIQKEVLLGKDGVDTDPRNPENRNNQGCDNNADKSLLYLQDILKRINATTFGKNKLQQPPLQKLSTEAPATRPTRSPWLPDILITLTGVLSLVVIAVIVVLTRSGKKSKTKRS